MHRSWRTEGPEEELVELAIVLSTTQGQGEEKEGEKPDRRLSRDTFQQLSKSIEGQGALWEGRDAWNPPGSWAICGPGRGEGAAERQSWRAPTSVAGPPGSRIGMLAGPWSLPVPVPLAVLPRGLDQ